MLHCKTLGAGNAPTSLLSYRTPARILNTLYVLLSRHEISNNVVHVGATSKGLDQPALTHSKVDCLFFACRVISHDFVVVF